jgi:hypothetical protein
MASSLKDKNKAALFAVMAVNLAVFYGAVKTDALFGGKWLELAKGLGEALPAGLGLVLVGIANAQLSAEAKARVVFLRWNNPLPGCEAFSRHASRDPRIDLDELGRRHGPLPSDPAQQNRLWYKLYKSVEAEPSIQQVHREFLFARDYACLALMMIVILGGVGFLQIRSLSTALGYFAILVLQFALTVRAARNHGRRFVTNVLATEGASATNG